MEDRLPTARPSQAVVQSPLQSQRSSMQRHLRSPGHTVGARPPAQISATSPTQRLQKLVTQHSLSTNVFNRSSSGPGTLHQSGSASSKGNISQSTLQQVASSPGVIGKQVSPPQTPVHGLHGLGSASRGVASTPAKVNSFWASEIGACASSSSPAASRSRSPSGIIGASCLPHVGSPQHAQVVPAPFPMLKPARGYPQPPLDGSPPVPGFRQARSSAQIPAGGNGAFSPRWSPSPTVPRKFSSCPSVQSPVTSARQAVVESLDVTKYQEALVNDTPERSSFSEHRGVQDQPRAIPHGLGAAARQYRSPTSGARMISATPGLDSCHGNSQSSLPSARPLNRRSLEIPLPRPVLQNLGFSHDVHWQSLNGRGYSLSSSSPTNARASTSSLSSTAWRQTSDRVGARLIGSNGALQASLKCLETRVEVVVISDSPRKDTLAGSQPSESSVTLYAPSEASPARPCEAPPVPLVKDDLQNSILPSEGTSSLADTLAASLDDSLESGELEAYLHSGKVTSAASDTPVTPALENVQVVAPHPAVLAVVESEGAVYQSNEIKVGDPVTTVAATFVVADSVVAATVGAQEVVLPTGVVVPPLQLGLHEVSSDQACLKPQEVIQSQNGKVIEEQLPEPSKGESSPDKSALRRMSNRTSATRTSATSEALSLASCGQNGVDEVVDALPERRDSKACMPGLGRRKPRPSLTKIELEAKADEVDKDAAFVDGSDEVCFHHAVTRRHSRLLEAQQAPPERPELMRSSTEMLDKFITPRKVSAEQISQDWRDIRRASHLSQGAMEDSNRTPSEILQDIYQDLISDIVIPDAGVELEESPAEHFGKITTVLLESRKKKDTM